MFDMIYDFKFLRTSEWNQNAEFSIQQRKQYLDFSKVQIF